MLASLLFGTLRNGATRMQSLADIPIDIIVIVQAMVIMFIAAPAIVRWLFRLRGAKAARRSTLAAVGASRAMTVAIANYAQAASLRKQRILGAVFLGIGLGDPAGAGA